MKHLLRGPGRESGEREIVQSRRELGSLLRLTISVPSSTHTRFTSRLPCVKHLIISVLTVLLMDVNCAVEKPSVVLLECS